MQSVISLCIYTPVLPIASLYLSCHYSGLGVTTKLFVYLESLAANIMRKFSVSLSVCLSLSLICMFFPAFIWINNVVTLTAASQACEYYSKRNNIVCLPNPLILEVITKSLLCVTKQYVLFSHKESISRLFCRSPTALVDVERQS